MRRSIWLWLLFVSPPLAVSASAQDDLDCTMSVLVYFESESAAIIPVAGETIDLVAAKLRDCEPLIIVVTGHVDNAEALTSPSLGTARALAVANKLRGLAPIVTEDAGASDPERLTGRGIREPLNRRVAIEARGAAPIPFQTDIAPPVEE